VCHRRGARRRVTHAPALGYAGDVFRQRTRPPLPQNYFPPKFISLCSKSTPIPRASLCHSIPYPFEPTPLSPHQAPVRPRSVVLGLATGEILAYPLPAPTAAPTAPGAPPPSMHGTAYGRERVGVGRPLAAFMTAETAAFDHFSILQSTHIPPNFLGARAQEWMSECCSFFLLICIPSWCPHMAGVRPQAVTKETDAFF